MAGGRASLLVVEDDADLAEQLRWALKDDYRLRLAGRRDEALEALRRGRPYYSGHELWNLQTGRRWKP